MWRLILAIIILFPSLANAQGFGLLYPRSTGSGTGLAPNSLVGEANIIVSGTQTVSGGKILGEDGSAMLGEDGTYILEDDSVVVEDHILGEDGTKMLGEDGSYILNEDSDFSHGVGINTALSPTSIVSPSLWVTANSNNQGTVWVGGANISVGIGGLPLIPNVQNTYLPIEDVSKVYITGYAGDGITYYYLSYTGTGYLQDTSGNFEHDTSGNLILGI